MQSPTYTSNPHPTGSRSLGAGSIKSCDISDTITGEARIRQSLDDSLGGPALMALQSLLANGFESWQEDSDGNFRHLVDDGYVVYRPDDRQLEIVATAQQDICETGCASERLTGSLTTEIETTGEGKYYDDGWGGHTKEKAEKDAQKNAEAGVQHIVRDRLDRQADTAEEEHAENLIQRAEADARERLNQRAENLTPELQQRARERLETVGIRGRQVFHRLLAHAYRDALSGLARRQGVASNDITTRETDEYLEIDFMMP
ncbi:MAG: response regulator receiver domain/DnaJ domain- containing protein [Candidatus Magnetoglobus multicellularis str. Araruama]|uniref:Response regulator receiver domain/DnaJ domain-containing protein n=1 Tax=Candidatus Magnetoglobus multicellularis str. Araruama TaxID=890399 RepID=A0A1V1NWU3_9BACT|nr:MAG: response regulator receiver domain/DnaJ domain- containing protein [Candidatus Magnetoglobus multicellularis str. Araruama]